MLLMVIAQLMIVLIIMTLSFIVVMPMMAWIVKRWSKKVRPDSCFTPMMYIQEGSRLGWAHNLDKTNAKSLIASQGAAATLGASYGWTDSRDGSLGPGDHALWCWQRQHAIPAPSWWTFPKSIPIS